HAVELVLNPLVLSGCALGKGTRGGEHNDLWARRSTGCRQTIRPGELGQGRPPLGAFGLDAPPEVALVDGEAPLADLGPGRFVQRIRVLAEELDDWPMEVGHDAVEVEEDCAQRLWNLDGRGHGINPDETPPFGGVVGWSGTL